MVRLADLEDADRAHLLVPRTQAHRLAGAEA